MELTAMDVAPVSRPPPRRPDPHGVTLRRLHRLNAALLGCLCCCTWPITLRLSAVLPRMMR
ncbi:MAG: hypothetical protein ACO3FX_13615, partial [Gemmobacter sp.]